MILILLVFWFYLWYRNSFVQAHKMFFWTGVAYKLLMVLLFGVIYWYWYGNGDAIFYYQIGLKITAKAKELPMEYLKFLLYQDHFWQQELDLPFQYLPRGAIFLKIISFIMLISFNSYWLSSLTLALFAFHGCWYLFQTIYLINQNWKIPALSAFIFFPSLVFWSAGLLKESLVIGFLGFGTGAFIRMVHQKQYSLKLLILLVLSLLAILIFKYYLAAVLIPCMIILTLYELIKPFRRKILIPVFFSGLILFFIPLINPNLQLSSLTEVVYNNYQLFHQKGGDNLIIFKQLSPDWQGLLNSIPKALFSGLFRPFFWEVKGFLPVIAGIESFILMILSLASLVLFTLKRSVNNNFLPYSIVIVFTSIIFSSFLTLAAPQFGALVRYRIIFWPFLLFVVLQQLNHYLRNQIAD